MATSASSKVKKGTDLPKTIDPAFVSHKNDYDYPYYISQKEEWVPEKYDNIRGRVIVSQPFLIMEVNRFVPFIENKFVRFHLLNMPRLVLNKIHIMGFVVAVSEDARFYKYQVDDGTGSITVYYDKSKFACDNRKRKLIDEKYQGNALKINSQTFKGQECPKRFHDPRPQFDYSPCATIRDKAIFEHKWWLETEKGLLGKYVKRCDYVIAAGYCNMDFMFRKRPAKKITFEDLTRSKKTFFAMNVSCLTEHDYNEKMTFWLEKIVPRRYGNDSKKSVRIPKFRSYPAKQMNYVYRKVSV